MLLGVARQSDAEVLLQLDAETAVDDQRVAGDERGFVRAQEHDRVGDVDGLASTADRILLAKKRSVSW